MNLDVVKRFLNGFSKSLYGVENVGVGDCAGAVVPVIAAVPLISAVPDGATGVPSSSVELTSDGISNVCPT